MTILRPYIAGAALAALLALSLAAWWGWQRVDALKADNAALSRAVVAMELQAHQAREARAVADASRKREAERAARLDASIETLLTGDLADADLDLDPRIAALLDCLRDGSGADCDPGAE